MKKKSLISIILSVFLPFMVGFIVIIILGYDPIEAYYELLKGAFVGKLNFGTTLEKFVPILLTGLAYCITTKVKYFNIGSEGSLYMGALFSAGVGYLIIGLPWYIHIPLCFLTAIIVGALWSSIAGILRVMFNVNEACVTIMLNYVAIYFTSYMCNNVWTAKTAAPQTPPMLSSAKLYQFLKPSRANTGIFIALVVFAFIYWLVMKSRMGYNIRSTGINTYFTDYVGINSKATVLATVLLSGGIAGFAGSLEVMGLYGNFMDEFAVNLAFDGMLASLIARNNLKLLPVTAFLMAALKAGALGMERSTGIPKALIDALIALFILLIVMDELFDFKGRSKKRKKSELSFTKI